MAWNKKMIALVGGLLALVGCGGSENKYEMPKYTVVRASGNIEIRDYAPMLVAEVQTKGEREKAVNEAFGILAGFIFGKNTPKQEIAMTAPVTQQSGQEISMTAPVTQQQNGDQIWTTAFSMPSQYSLENLPKPTDSRIQIRETDGKRMIAIRFSGRWSENNMQQHEKQLQEYIAAQNLKTLGQPVYAFYNDPFTLPWNRRNEILWQIQQ